MTNPYDELIQRVEQSIQSLMRSNFARDARRDRLERKKILLLALILVSAWLIFFLVYNRLDSVVEPSPEPPRQYEPPAHYQIHEGSEPIYAI
jgi:hypothetical protein